MTLQHTSRYFTILELLRLVDRGRLALPDFQRQFVWEPSNVVELLDSVINGWPIGSLLLLEGPQPFRVRPIEGAPSPVNGEAELYLLDGQQRITSIYQALMGRGGTVYYVDFCHPDQDGRPQIRWAAEARVSGLTKNHDVFLLSHLMSKSKLDSALSYRSGGDRDWLLTVKDRFTDEQSGGHYLVPATVMERSISLEALTRIFETLNRTGVRLNAFDLMVALLYPSGFNLREEWKSATARLPLLKDFKIDGLEILKLIALWQRDIDSVLQDRPLSRRVTGVRQRDVLNIPSDFVDEHWAKAVDTYEASLRLMVNNFGVRGPKGIPSVAMILSMAYFLNAGFEENKIERWYWSSIAMQTYAQGANTQVVTDTRTDSPPAGELRVIEGALRSSLLDESRRNKILRLGLRGMFVADGAADPVSGQGMRDAPPEESLTEVSVPDLLRGAVTSGLDSSVIDLIVLTPDSRRRLAGHRDSSSASLLQLLKPQFLQTQDFYANIGQESSMEQRERLDTVVNRVMERVR